MYSRINQANTVEHIALLKCLICMRFDFPRSVIVHSVLGHEVVVYPFDGVSAAIDIILPENGRQASLFKQVFHLKE